jgi:hypothetical protein
MCILTPDAFWLMTVIKVALGRTATVTLGCIVGDAMPLRSA